MPARVFDVGDNEMLAPAPEQGEAAERGEQGGGGLGDDGCEPRTSNSATTFERAFPSPKFIPNVLN